MILEGVHMHMNLNLSARGFFFLKCFPDPKPMTKIFRINEAAMTLIFDLSAADLDSEALAVFTHVFFLQLSQIQTIAGILHFLPQPAAPADWLINGRSACRWKNVCPQLNFLCFSAGLFFLSLSFLF